MKRFIIIVISCCIFSGISAQSKYDPIQKDSGWSPTIFRHKKDELLNRKHVSSHQKQSIQVCQPEQDQSVFSTSYDEINRVEAFYQGDGNTGHQYQLGMANTALLNVSGDNNYSRQYQSGSHNLSSITIIGLNNIAETRQLGDCGPSTQNKAKIFIQGKENYAGISQFNTSF